MLNKRGDMPTVMILVMALVLVVATLFSFASFKDNVKGESIALSKVQRGIEFNQEYILKSAELIAGKAAEDNDYKLGIINLRQSFINVAKSRDIQLYGSGNFFTKVAAGDFIFDKIGGGYVLSIKDLIVFADSSQPILTETKGTLLWNAYGVYTFVDDTGDKIRRNFNIEMTFDSSGNLLTKKITYNS
jgi:hypothetical protein